MPRDTTVIPFRQPEAIDDPLTEVAREGDSKNGLMAKGLDTTMIKATAIKTARRGNGIGVSPATAAAAMAPTAARKALICIEDIRSINNK